MERVFRCPSCRGHLQIHGRVFPIGTALLVAIGFLALDFSGKTDVNFGTLWWDAFQIGSVLFVLFVMLGWLLRVDRRQPAANSSPNRETALRSCLGQNFQAR